MLLFFLSNKILSVNQLIIYQSINQFLISIFVSCLLYIITLIFICLYDFPGDLQILKRGLINVERFINIKDKRYKQMLTRKLKHLERWPHFFIYMIFYSLRYIPNEVNNKQMQTRQKKQYVILLICNFCKIECQVHVRIVMTRFRDRVRALRDILPRIAA